MSAEVRPNGFVGSYLVMHDGCVVATGLTLAASEAYAKQLNEEADMDKVQKPVSKPRPKPTASKSTPVTK